MDYHNEEKSRRRLKIELDGVFKAGDYESEREARKKAKKEKRRLKEDRRIDKKKAA